MAYKVFEAGQEALAADVNTHLMSQTVSRFANAPTRTAELASPALNQLSVLNDRPGIVQYWTGAAWADLVTPTLPLPGGFHLQSGNVVGMTDPYGSVNFNFPVAFSGQPVAVGVEAGGLAANCSVINITNATVTFAIHNLDGSPIVSNNVRVMYMATGLR